VIFYISARILACSDTQAALGGGFGSSGASTAPKSPSLVLRFSEFDLEMLIFLLERNYVVQQHSYIFLVLPEPETTVSRSMSDVVVEKRADQLARIDSMPGLEMFSFVAQIEENDLAMKQSDIDLGPTVSVRAVVSLR
jgi:hypothetical protein